MPIPAGRHPPHFRRHVALLLAAALVLAGSMLAVPEHQAQAQAAAPPGDQVRVQVGGGELSGITANPTLSPAFSTSTHDYVVRCRSGVNHVTLNLAAAGGGTITVGPQSGPTVSVTVQLGENQAAVVSAGEQGEYWIRCLPHDFPQMQVARPGNPAPGWYVTGTVLGATDLSSVPYVMILDNNGTPVWYQRTPDGAIDARLIPGGGNEIAWVPLLGPGIGADPTRGYNVHDLDTGTTASVKTNEGPTDPHELLQVANGNRFLISTPIVGPGNAPADNTFVDCIVEELNPAGQTVWSWKASEHIPTSEAISPVVVTVGAKKAADVYHCNSVDVDPDPESPTAGDVLISVRHTNAVYLVDKVTKKITWKLGGEPVTGGDNEQRLNILLDPQGGFNGQHDARFLGGGRFSLFDNHHYEPRGYARGVEYDVNQLLGTATQVRQFAEPTGKSAFATGSYRTYDNGAANLVAWGFRPGSGFDEFDADGNSMLSLTYPKGDLEYRVVKEPQAALDLDLLRRTAGRPRPTFPTVTWLPAGGILTSKPAVASWAPNRLDTFVRGNDYQLWHRWWEGNVGSHWEPLGGHLGSGAGVASWAPGRLDVFVTGSDRQLWHKWWDGTAWSYWEPQGGYLLSGPAAVSWGPGRLDVVAVGADSALWHKWYDSRFGWSRWESLGGVVRDEPAITSWGSDRLDVFVHGVDNQLWHKWWDGTGWYGWEPLGGNLAAGPAATSLGPGLINVVATGAGGVPERLPYNGGWQIWQPLGGQTYYSPAAIAVRPDSEHPFVTGTDNQLWIGVLSKVGTSAAARSAGAADTQPSEPVRRQDAAGL